VSLRLAGAFAKFQTAPLHRRRTIIGFTAEGAERIGYGKLVLDVTVSKGSPTNLQAIEVKRSFSLNA
jgi:hypothetical protein